MTDKTNAARQAAHRKRQQEQGLVEVRGIYAKPEHHAKIKEFAKELAKTT